MPEYEKVRPNQLVQPRASTWNRFVDAADLVLSSRERTKKFGKPTENYTLVPTVMVGVQNTTGESVNRFGILQLDSLIVVPDSDTKFNRQQDKFVPKYFTGIKPEDYSPLKKSVIVQRMVGDDAIAPAMLAGCSWTKLNVNDEGHQFAIQKKDDLEALDTARNGPAKILWKESGTGTKWGIVELLRNVPMALIGKTDGSGITARSSNTPGQGTVNMYFRDPTSGDLVAFNDSEGNQISDTVYNVSEQAVAADTFIFVQDDSFNTPWVTVESCPA